MENQIMYFQNAKLDKLLSASKLVVFDMNGLIIDDELIQMQAMNNTLEKFGVEYNKTTWPVGRRIGEFIKTTMDDNNISPDKYSINEIVKRKNDYYGPAVIKAVKDIVNPGVIELIGYLSNQKNLILALATSATKVEIGMILGEQSLNIQEKFSVMISGDDVEKAKPDPEIYKKVSQKANISPDHSLVFEDTDVGVESANSAGMKCIAVPNEFTENQDFSKATYIVNNLTQKAKII